MLLSSPIYKAGCPCPGIIYVQILIFCSFLCWGMAAPEQQLVWGASRPAVWGGTAEGCLGKGGAAAPALSFMIFPISELSKG